MSPATGRALKRNSSLGAGAGSARLFLLLLIGLLACAAYAGYSVLTLYERLDAGRQELVGASARLSSTGQGGVPSSAETAAGLRQAELDFEDARRRAAEDPAFRALSVLPAGATQVDASRRLGAIGADVSRAGESAAAIASQLESLRRQYSGRTLGPADLPAVLQQAEAIAARYAASARAISDQLKAAHAERAAVRTDRLLPPLRDAYAQVDSLLARADTAFSRYQDVRDLVSEVVSVPIP